MDKVWLYIGGIFVALILAVSVVFSLVRGSFPPAG